MLQFLTLNRWYSIPIIWLPVVCWFTAKAFKMGQTPPKIALILLFGILIWSLMEYTLHRFLFHIKTKSYWCVINLLSFCFFLCTAPYLHGRSYYFCNCLLNYVIFLGGTHFIIFFMAVITSILRMDYASCSLLLQPPFSWCRYVIIQECHSINLYL